MATDGQQPGHDILQQRGHWTNWTEYLLSFLGALVGYGNVWRFPYVCYRNGGGAFLIPYFICLIICGIPILFLETLCSQYSTFGPGRVWEMCPLFKGIGMCMVITVSVVSLYYTMIMAWTAFFLANSFRSPLPWSTCDNYWNTANCTSSGNDTMLENVHKNTSLNALSTENDETWTKLSPAEEFWFNRALSVSDNIGNIGSIQWELAVCLLASWLVTCVCLVKGIKSIGKIAYVAAPLPFFILLCLLIRGCLLPGASQGLYYFIVPRWELLGNFLVWRDAFTQVFYSIGIGAGAASTLASYSKFHNNCYRDSITVGLLDSFTSLFAGMVIFTYLGYTADVTDKPMDQVVAQGPGLVFMAYPSALATIPLAQLWSVLFFFMLFVMGLDSQFIHVEILVTAILDVFPQFLSKRLSLTVLACVLGFLLGLPFTTKAGVFILNLVDWYISCFSYLLSIALEVAVISWFYGCKRLYSDIEHMIGYQPTVLFKYSWAFVTPAILMFMWVASLVIFEAITTKLPGFDRTSDVVGMVIAILPVLCVPGVALWELSQQGGSLSQRIRTSLRPSSLWQPAIYKTVTNQHENENA